MEEIERNITIPILLIAFNRPSTTTQVFDRIRAAKPQTLYVAVDGPRFTKERELNLVEEVKAIVKSVDWPCETHYKFNEVNLGAEVTVSSAISWVFENEEYVIVLEDDIIAPLSFFKFAQEMLIKYKDDPRIGIISGNNFTPMPLKDNSDYFFAKYAHSWGWATWKRVWTSFDLNIKVDRKHLARKFLKSISNSKEEAKFYKKRFKIMKKKGHGNSTWDIVANYISRVNNRINIVPRVNLTSNIGIYGLHSKGESVFHNIPYDEEFVVKNHPNKVEVYKEYDIYHFREHILKYKKSFIQRVINKISRLFIGKNIIK